MPCLSVYRTNNDDYSRHLLRDSLKWNVHQAYAKDLDRCIKEFKELIEMLGLPWEHYEGFVDQNLRPQFAWGKRGRKPITVVSTRNQKVVLKSGAFNVKDFSDTQARLAELASGSARASEWLWVSNEYNSDDTY
jgi:hypothetical protein